MSCILKHRNLENTEPYPDWYWPRFYWRTWSSRLSCTWIGTDLEVFIGEGHLLQILQPTILHFGSEITLQEHCKHQKLSKTTFILKLNLFFFSVAPPLIFCRFFQLLIKKNIMLMFGRFSQLLKKKKKYNINTW